MKKILYEYTGFIRSFEKLLKDKYNTEKNPCHVAGILFDRIGCIDGIHYFFHGTGCTAEKDRVTYRYDISIFRKDEIEFTLWELLEFIRTHKIYSIINYDSAFIESELEKMIQDGTLAWLTIMDKEYRVYRVLQE
ncbi:hypothetical protein [Flavobacterium sp.]|uniref:DUF6896 domain-containing protein n=1 Tax=Flavobacterium sp. TaxID=239 RepID=UPI0031D3E611